MSSYHSCEVCNTSADYCDACGTCHKCTQDDIDRLTAEVSKVKQMIPWDKTEGLPDVPVSQERYDRLTAELSATQSLLAEAKEQTRNAVNAGHALAESVVAQEKEIIELKAALQKYEGAVEVEGVLDSAFRIVLAEPMLVEPMFVTVWVKRREG